MTHRAFSHLCAANSERKVAFSFESFPTTMLATGNSFDQSHNAASNVLAVDLGKRTNETS
jgi:hypothetical protein